VTDGARLYFTEFIGGRPTPVAVPVTGGEPVPIRSPLGQASGSADGTYFRPRLPGWNNPPNDCSGSWSPDGRYFLFDSYREGPDGVWAVREEGSLFERWSSKPVLLLEGPGNAGKPVVSRDGKRVFFMATPAAKAGLARFNTRAASWTPFLSGLSAEQVSFSHLGGSVAYVSFPGRQLVTATADGRQPFQLTSPPLEAASPRWSPDGKRIAFMGRLPGKNWQIYVVPAKGGDPHPLFHTGVEEADPDWSPDGGSLLFFRELLHGQKALDPVLFCRRSPHQPDQTDPWERRLLLRSLFAERPLHRIHPRLHPGRDFRPEDREVGRTGEGGRLCTLLVSHLGIRLFSRLVDNRILPGSGQRPQAPASPRSGLPGRRRGEEQLDRRGAG